MNNDIVGFIPASLFCAFSFIITYYSVFMFDGQIHVYLFFFSLLSYLEIGNFLFRNKIHHSKYLGVIYKLTYTLNEHLQKSISLLYFLSLPFSVLVYLYHLPLSICNFRSFFTLNFKYYFVYIFQVSSLGTQLFVNLLLTINLSYHFTLIFCLFVLCNLRKLF